jgi:hypothetical protein
MYTVFYSDGDDNIRREVVDKQALEELVFKRNKEIWDFDVNGDDFIKELSRVIMIVEGEVKPVEIKGLKVSISI